MGASLEQTLADLEAAIAGMSEPEFAAAPAGKWSISQILEHLSITYASSNDRVIAKVLSSGPSYTPPNFKQRVATFSVTTLGYLPTGRKAPEFTRPKGRPTAEILADIRRALPEMENGLAECERRYGSRKIADHPILGALNARQWRNFHRAHTRHHLKQIASRRQSLQSAAASR
jgi:hypothetical protein